MILTNDAATILRELDVVHPAAKLIVMASQQQEAEVGDTTDTKRMEDHAWEGRQG